jgi:TolA-binding protein
MPQEKKLAKENEKLEKQSGRSDMEVGRLQRQSDKSNREVERLDTEVKRCHEMIQRLLEVIDRLTQQRTWHMKGNYNVNGVAWRLYEYLFLYTIISAVFIFTNKVKLDYEVILSSLDL